MKGQMSVRKLFFLFMERMDFLDGFMLGHYLTYLLLGKHRELDRIRDARDGITAE